MVIFSMKIPLHRSKFGEKLASKRNADSKHEAKPYSKPKQIPTPRAWGCEDLMPSVYSLYLYFLFLQIRKNPIL
jgi:hypothetical protein